MASKGKKSRSKKKKKKGGRKGSKKKAVEQVQEPAEDELPADAPEEEADPEQAEGGSDAAVAEEEPASPDDDSDEEPEVYSLDDAGVEPEVYALDDDEAPEEEPEVFSLDEDEEEPEVFSLDEDDGSAEDEPADDEAVEVLDEDEDEDLDAATLIAQVTGAADADEQAEDAGAASDEVEEDELPESEGGDESAEGEPAEPVPTSTPEARDRIVAAALAHAEMQEARYRVRTDSRSVSRWKGRMALALFALAGFLTVFPPDLVVPEAPPPLSEAELMRGRRMTLLLQAEQIEAYRVRESVTPPSLADVTVRAPNIRYVRSSNRLYQLVTYTPTGETVLYDSQRPGDAFERLTPNWPEDGS